MDGKKKGVEPSPSPIKPGDIRRYVFFNQLSASEESVLEYFFFMFLQYKQVNFLKGLHLKIPSLAF